MSVRLFVCLGFIASIAASNSYTHSKHESSSGYVQYNHKSIRKLVNDPKLDNSAGSTSETNKTVVPLIKEKDKNKTVTKKPVDKEGTVTQGIQGFSNLYPPYVSYYEVTENVVDIPDDRTPAGPVDVNYTPAPVLNLAKPVNKTGGDKTTEANKATTKKSWLTILHINAGYDDKEHVVHDNKVIGLLKGIKSYLKSVKRGIINGVHSFFHKHEDERDIEEEIERAVASKISEDCS